ncbi:hypothetical protein [Streptomyces sp. NPDC059874]|uniref:hypothetical protein n=1 Tax=Streptomyces sp. NPDC059874 TaxID=3346983 RepID=UPI003653FEDA
MNTGEFRYGNVDNMQTCWSEATPGEIHATWSGYRTACGRLVIEAKPCPDSTVDEITCAECGATAVFDLNTARRHARIVTEKYEATGALSWGDAFRLRETAIEGIAPQAFAARRRGDSWNAISTAFLMSTGAATDNDPTSRFVGKVGLAVIDALKESEHFRKSDR